MPYWGKFAIGYRTQSDLAAETYLEAAVKKLLAAQARLYL